MSTRARNWWLLGLAALLLVILVWQRTQPVDDAFGPRSEASQGTVEGTSDTVAEADLPAEARDTLALIDRGGPFPYEEDGQTFFNREGLLPDREQGHYREYTVETPGSDDRGARRIVVGGGSVYWWTEDHYRSFRMIERDRP